MTTILPRPSRPNTQPDNYAEAPRASVGPLGESGHTLQPSRKVPINPRNLNRHKTSAHALAMLTQHSVFVAPVPRFHVKPRWVDGTHMVHDRALDQQFKVYTPRFVSQFRAGHHAGLWYLRPSADLGLAPRSQGFPTVGEAIEALRSGHWARSSSPASRTRARCRVIWS